MTKLLEKKTISELQSSAIELEKEGYHRISDIFMSDHDFSTKTFCLIMSNDNE